MLRPGIVLLGFANLSMLTTIFLCFSALRSQRSFAMAAVALTLLFSLGIGSGMGGYFRPVPSIAIDIEPTRADSAPGEQVGTITVTNEGHRDMHLVPYPSEARGAYLFILEQRIGGNSWSEVGGQGAAHAKTRTIGPGEHLAIQISLVPGEYRFSLISKISEEDTIYPFSVEETARPLPDPPPTPKNVAPPESEGADSNPEEATP